LNRTKHIKNLHFPLQFCVSFSRTCIQFQGILIVVEEKLSYFNILCRLHVILLWNREKL